MNLPLTEQIFNLNATGKYQEALDLHKELYKIQPELYPYQEWLSLINLGRMQEAWDMFSQTPYLKAFKALRKAELPSNGLTLVAEQGVGDEIRVSSIYNEVAPKYATCDPRLLTLFSRSFPRTKFYPATRFYNSNAQGLKLFLGDDTMNLAIRGEPLVTNYSALSVYRSQPEDFLGVNVNGWLEPLPGLQNKWRHILNGISSKPKIGIATGSVANSFTKDIHKIPFAHWEPVFKLKDKYDFVNLQANFSQDDHDVITKLGAQVYHMNNVDLWNNFEESASLYSCLDAVIAPPNYVTDLAASVGTPTITFCNSLQHKWRFPDQFSRDLWSAKGTGLFADNKQQMMEKVAAVLANI